MRDFEHITVFLKDGGTIRFHDVKGYGTFENNSARFTYVSASDGKTNIAVLNINNVVMVAGVPKP